MKTLFPRSLALLTLLVTSAVQAAAPANDKFENATVLIPGGAKLLNQNGALSTPDALDPFVGGVKLTRSVWYRFDAAATATAARLIIDDHTGVRAAVFRLADPDGNAGTLEFLTQTNNTAGSDVDTLTFPTTLGERYYICVEGNGLFDLTLRVPLVENDYFADAIALVGDEGTITGSNVGAINTDDAPPALTAPASNLTRGVWYSWTPSFTAQAVVDTNFSEDSNGTRLDTVVAVFTGSSLATLVQVAANDDDGLGTNSRATFAATAGTTYRIWVGNYNSSSPGPLTLSYYKEGNIGEFRLDSLPTTVGENQGAVQFTVRRYRAGNVIASVTLSTVNGSATAGSDFTAINTVLNFTSGTGDTGLQKSAFLQMLPDAVFENNENFQVSLSSPTPGGGTAGSPATILLIDGAPTTAAGFTTGTLRVKETDGSITVPLYRSGIGGYAETKIIGNLSNSTAAESRDYSPVNATIAFQPGQSQGSLTVTILNDGFFEGSETLVLKAISAFPGVSLTGPSTLAITIEDDDLPPAISGRLAANFSSPTITGSVDIKISATGSVTGKVIMAKGSLPFTGTLVNGRLTVRLSTVPNRTLDIQLVNAVTKTYQLTLNDGDLGSVSTASASPTNFSKLTPCPVAGNYTFADSIGGGGVPQLIAATIKADTLGTATLAGKLFDGTAVVATGAVDSVNIAWVGASIYAGKGRVIAAAALNTTPETITGAQVEVIRPGRSNQSVELPSISTGTVAAFVARYVPPASGQRAFTIWSGGTGNADLIGGGFGALTTKAFTISTANKITVTTLLPERLSITLTPSTGVFTGSVLPTGATAPKSIYGVLLQDGGGSLGYGFFLNGITPGKVTLRGP